MKCKDAQRFLTGLTSETLAPDEVEEALRHVQACEECARFVSFSDQFEAALSTKPLLNPQLFGRIEGGIARSARRAPIYTSWMRTFGEPNLMKKLTLTAASAAALTIAGIGLMSSAQGAEPKAKFNSMRNAVLAKAQHGTTQVQAGMSSKGTWLLVNGQLVQPDPSGTTHIDGPGGSHLVVTTKKGPSSLTLTARGKDEALKGVGGGVSVKTRSGKPVNLGASGARFFAANPGPLSLDLDMNHYQAIAFGGSSNTLVLTPTGNEGQRYLVNLNPNSALPVSMSLEQKTSGKWTRVRESKVVI